MALLDLARNRAETGAPPAGIAPVTPKLPAPAASYGVAILLLFTLATLWSLSYTFLKLTVATIPPVTLTAVRMVVAGLLLVIWMRILGVPWPVDSATRRHLVVQSLLNSVVPFTLIAWAQSQVDVNIAVILSSTSPIFAFFITWGITRHEPATLRKLFGVISGLTGICLIVGLSAFGGGGRDLIAQFALLGAALSYACSAIYGRRFDRLGPVAPSAVTLITASFLLVPASLILDRPWTLSPSVESMVALAALSVFSTAIAYVIYFWLLRNLGSIGVTSQSYLRIPLGVMFGMVFFGEVLLSSTWLGLAFVLVGVVLMTLPTPKAKSADPIEPPPA
jgi:drug/metabolite transporter (DMT)-like permease